MREKNIFEGSFKFEDVGDVIDLPHMDKLKKDLAERVKHNTMTSFPTV